MLHGLFLLGEIKTKVLRLRFIHLHSALQQPVGKRFCHIEQLVVSVSLFLTGKCHFFFTFSYDNKFCFNSHCAPPCTVIIYSIAVVTLCCSKNVRAWPAQRVDKPGAVIGTAFFRQSGSAKWTAIPPASAGQVYPARCRTDGPRFQRIR